MTVRLLALFLVVLHAVPASAARQEEPPPERVLVQRAISVLRSSRSTEAERAEATDALLELGERGPRALASHLERVLRKQRKTNAKDEAKLLQSFSKRAGKVVDARLDRKTLAEIEAQRRVVLGNAHGEGLTKEKIELESDPAMARLRELLTVRPNDVWDVDEDLFEDWSLLLDARDAELAGVRDWERAREVILARPGGDAIVKRWKAPEVPGSTESLIAQLARTADLATPMTDRDREVFESNAAEASQLTPGEPEGIFALNLRLVLLALPAQSIDVKLCAACRGHSKDMHDHGFFSHDSPLPGKRTFGDRAALAGTSASSENIAVGATTGEAAIRQWWYSPGHHSNMLGGHARVGLGRHERHWTQNFGG